MRSFLAIDPLPRPHSHFEAEWKSAIRREKKKVGFCLSLSLSSLCIFVSFRLSKLFCLLSNRVFICFCFVRKAHQKPKWIWKHLHRCPRRAECCRSQSFSDLKIHLPRRRWQFGWKMEHEAIMCSAVVSRELPTSPDGAERRVANWGVHGQTIWIKKGWIATMCHYSIGHIKLTSPECELAEKM